MTAIAVGLRLKEKDTDGNYIPVEKVKEHFKIYSSSRIDINKNEDLISGGSRIVDPFSGIGRLLHWNIINEMIFWSADSRSHINEDSKSIVPYTVGYDHKYIEGFGYLHISSDFESADFAGSNKGCVIILPSNGWVMAGVGGCTYVKDSNLARFWNYPSGFYGFVKDTDYINSASGRLTVGITQIQKDRLLIFDRR